MNLLVTLDSNYIKPLTVLMRSIMISNPGETFDLYVAHSSLTAEDFRKIAQSVDPARTRIHSVTVPAETLAHVPVLKRLTKETYYRLLALDFMPAGTDRVLYLDPDIVIINPLRPLYDMPLDNSLLAAAGHTTGLIEHINHKRLHMAKGSRYINAGVILMDIAAMRREITTDDILSFIEQNIKRLVLGDQDVFNAFFTGRIKILDERLYNLDEKTYSRYQRKEHIDPLWVREHTVVIHYNGQYKPWKEGYKGVLQGFYYEIDGSYAAAPGRGIERTVKA